MAVRHSSDEDKSYFDLSCHRETGETWTETLPAPLAWLAGDDLTLEVKADEKAFTTGNAFIETGRTDGTVSGVRVSQADRWLHGFGRGAVVLDAGRLRDGVAKLVSWGQAHELAGGDRNGTKGIPIPVADCLTSPVAAGPLPSRPVLHEVSFPDGSPAHQALTTDPSEGLKELDKSMGWNKDRTYGELAESYFASLLAAMPLADATIDDRSDEVAIRRHQTAGGYRYCLEVEFRQAGELVGIGAVRRASLWVLTLDGAAVLVPRESVKALARRRWADRRSRGTCEVIVLPLSELVCCAGARLPVGLTPVASSVPAHA